MGPEADEITALLRQSGAGDRAALERLLARVYSDLRRIARARLRGEHAETLDTTGLVHEAWLAMDGTRPAGFLDRRHYFAVAARAMRHVLIDRARQRGADKRQAPAPACAEAVHEDDGVEVMALAQALLRLAQLSPRLAQVVELRLHAGLTQAEIAALLGVTERTIDRDWLKARALLAQWLEPA